MFKKIYPYEWMLARVLEYLNSGKSYRSIAKANGIGKTTLARWVAAYNAHGKDALRPKGKKSCYFREFKIKCVEAVLRGEISVDACTAKYHISHDSVLRHWISSYNANKELKDYDPKPEVYMTESRRKTTIEERIKIVKYCIEHNRNYKETAVNFKVSYDQVYSWVRKYDDGGEDALKDRRGQRKKDEDLDELERLRRENKNLKRKLEEKDMIVELLKKVKEFERM